MKAKQQSDNSNRFVRLIHKHAEITELTPEIVRVFIVTCMSTDNLSSELMSEIVREFIEKIVVHEKQKGDIRGLSKI